MYLSPYLAGISRTSMKRAAKQHVISKYLLFQMSANDAMCRNWVHFIFYRVFPTFHDTVYPRYTVLFENQNFDFSACANKPGGGSVDIMTLLHNRKELTLEEGTKVIHSDPYKPTLNLMITGLLCVGLHL